jgi:hypothetical protein
MMSDWTTTNRSDFTWPYLAERQRIIDWDSYEYKEQICKNAELSDCSQPSKQSSCDVETLQQTRSQKFPFDFDYRPKPIVESGQSINRYPIEV